MDYEEFKRLTPQYINGRLDEGGISRYESALGKGGACLAYYKGMQETDILYKSISFLETQLQFQDIIDGLPLRPVVAPRIKQKFENLLHNGDVYWAEKYISEFSSRFNSLGIMASEIVMDPELIKSRAFRNTAYYTIEEMLLTG